MQIDRETVISLARKAGFLTGEMHGGDGQPLYPIVLPSGNGCIVELERFATLVAEAEREACLAMVKARRNDASFAAITNDDDKAAQWASIGAVCSVLIDDIAARGTGGKG